MSSVGPGSYQVASDLRRKTFNRLVQESPDIMDPGCVCQAAAPQLQGGNTGPFLWGPAQRSQGKSTQRRRKGTVLAEGIKVAHADETAQLERNRPQHALLQQLQVTQNVEGSETFEA